MLRLAGKYWLRSIGLQSVVLIPSLNPDEKLIRLLEGLHELDIRDILLVDDGSKPETKHYFEQARQMGCRVVTHAVNLGKGRALKTGFNAFLNLFPDRPGVVMADADGQHSPQDILKVGRAMEEQPGIMIMGCRDFSQENVPFKSRFGNKITRAVFGFLAGQKLSDTQTGLRGVPKQAMSWMMEVKGERFEYEMNMLVECPRHNLKWIEVPIETIYIEDNASSHFNPLKDALRIYSILGKYALSSFGSSLLDLGLFSLFAKVLFPMSFVWRVEASVACARVISAYFNYAVNRHVVFRSGEKGTSLVRYIILAVCQLLLSMGLTGALTRLLCIDEIIVKIVVDIILFMCSFKIQQKWVFVKKN